MTQTKRATLSGIADAVGLSVNTVSRALANKDGVSPRARDAVAREAARVGYVPPSMGTRSESKTIALTVTSSINDFIARLIPAVESALRAHGYSIVLRVTEESEAVEASAIVAMAEGDYAGAIVIPVQGKENHWADAGLSFPIVAVAREIEGLDCDFVSMDHDAAMHAVTRHALAQGARSLYFFDEGLDNSTNRSRVASFESALTTAPDAMGQVVSIPTRRFENLTRPWQPEEAYRSVSAVLNGGAAPDAMLFEDDYYSLGALRALAERGLRVPEDVLVVGYGDHPYSPYLHPSLTSVSMPVQVIAEAGVSILLRRIAGDQTSPGSRIVPAELVVRESSVRPAVVRASMH